jgi:small subunit ribosomal protein S20
MRQNALRAERNKARRTNIKTRVRKVTDAITMKDAAAADKALREVIVVLDRNATRGTIHRNTAARRKSRLMRRVNALKGAGR